jgi:predicted RNA polymerase sigma factor
MCGLSTHEIAKAFLTNEETISKEFYRAKEKIKADKIELGCRTKGITGPARYSSENAFISYSTRL